MLRKMGLDPKAVDAAEIRADFEAMHKQKTALRISSKTQKRKLNPFNRNCPMWSNMSNTDIQEIIPPYQKSPMSRKTTEKQSDNESTVALLIKVFLSAMPFYIIYFHSSVRDHCD